MILPKISRKWNRKPKLKSFQLILSELKTPIKKDLLFSCLFFFNSYETEHRFNSYSFCKTQNPNIKSLTRQPLFLLSIQLRTNYKDQPLLHHQSNLTKRQRGHSLCSASTSTEPYLHIGTISQLFLQQLIIGKYKNKNLQTQNFIYTFIIQRPAQTQALKQQPHHCKSQHTSAIPKPTEFPVLFHC